MANATDAPDLNFCYPIDLTKLQNDTVRLVPFNHDLPLFADHYVRHTTTPSALSNFRWLPYGPFHTTADFLEWYNKVIQPSDAVVWFAVLVSVDAARDAQRQRRDAGLEAELDEGMKVRLNDAKKGEGKEGGEGEEYFAGSIGFLNAKASDAVCEFGHINIIPPFQRTFIPTHSNTLLLHYLLDPPPAGLALRRVVWLANALNIRSVNAAKRLGFTFEGVMRWHRVLDDEKEGRRNEEDGRGPGRDTAMLSITWEEWEGIDGAEGVRERLRALNER